MFKHPIRFYNWTPSESQQSFLNFLKLYEHKKFTEKNISIKISFESETLCRIILRSDNRKIDFTATYNFLEFDKKLLTASQLLLA